MIMDLLLSSFYVDVFFPLSLSRLLPDLTEYMSNTADILQEPETFLGTARQNKDFQISHTLKLAWVLSSCMFLLHLIL
jgi:hypothetical protein